MEMLWFGIKYFEIEKNLQYMVVPVIRLDGDLKEAHVFISFRKPLDVWSCAEIGLKEYELVEPLCEVMLKKGFILEKQEDGSKSFLLGLFLRGILILFPRKKPSDILERGAELWFIPSPIAQDGDFYTVFKDCFENPL
jgi:hypothetical protein